MKSHIVIEFLRLAKGFVLVGKICRIGMIAVEEVFNYFLVRYAKVFLNQFLILLVKKIFSVRPIVIDIFEK